MAQVQFPDLLQSQDMTFADEFQMDGNGIDPPAPAPQDHITVFVSGQTFYMLPELFDQVRCLPWYQVGGLYHLDAEADLFEVILQFYLSGALPSKALLKKRRESLYQLTALLQNATELKMYIQSGKKTKSSSCSTLPSKRGLSLLKMKNKANIPPAPPAVEKKQSKSFFSFKSKKQSKPFDDLDDTQSITSGALSQVTAATAATQASTGTTMSEKENPKKRQKGSNGWNIMNRPKLLEFSKNCQAITIYYFVWQLADENAIMGWFDDDDDDEEEEQDRKSKTSYLAGNDDNGEDEVDPLDAYMQDINTKAKHDQETAGQTTQSERLDVENEEEATSHWQEPSASALTEDAAATEAAMEAKAAMEATFEKALDGKQSRQVDIQLTKVKHSSVEYPDFNKAIIPSENDSSNAAGDMWRRENSITCNPPMDPIYDFAELRDVVPDPIMEWIRSNGYQNPTLVQSQTLGVALRGKDAIITSHTGSGKTLAYLWPLVAHLKENNRKCRALVLVPTRELAAQVEKVAKSMFRDLHHYSALAITGGNMGRYQLSQALIRNKPHLVVATPGRLLDVLSAQQKNKQNWLLQDISFLVLDEADKMLQLGFAPQVSQVLDNLRPDRQSLLTSATLTKKLERMCREWMDDPIRISVGRTGQSSEHVEQHVMCLPDAQAKEAFLKEMLPTFCDVGRTLVFCATREGCEALGQKLQAVVPTVTLHGDKHGHDRKAALKAFTKGQVKLLVATDLAGRGLDVPQVGTVINFEPAKNWDTHVHRIGRAGRLSTKEQQSGSAYTLLLPSNADFAYTLVQEFTREKRPVGDDLRSLANRSRTNKSQKRGETGGLPDGSHRNLKDKSGLGYYGPSGPVADSGVPPPKRSRWS
ncbi:unnamed protein product [Cylindrotheca closterium]|uniref:RNA helicase n=1 Tax=Cylindrotheca closterium TaxID=2856 RepID=A0AAD2FPH8_9STRA|nr:unnamed protein product [Cylindrotheca closterium]